MESFSSFIFSWLRIVVVVVVVTLGCNINSADSQYWREENYMFLSSPFMTRMTVHAVYNTSSNKVNRYGPNHRQVIDNWHDIVDSIRGLCECCPQYRVSIYFLSLICNVDKSRAGLSLNIFNILNSIVVGYAVVIQWRGSVAIAVGLLNDFRADFRKAEWKAGRFSFQCRWGIAAHYCSIIDLPVFTRTLNCSNEV